LWIVWLIGALTAKRSVERQSLNSRLLQSLLVIAAFFLLFSHRWPNWLPRRFLPQSEPAFLWLGLALTALGISFAIWARLWIGRNWSGTITIKEHHELVQTGPYALVRHPIYSGLLLAFLGTAIVFGEFRGLIGLPLVAFGFALKMKMEESFMVQQFGNTYLEYKRRVKALVPFVV
jgi:protein-S-isoprenylcysteine O-methyltransferase Ste14